MLLHNINLTEEDVENGLRFFEEERIYPVDEENMFRAGIYCILSAAENYRKHRAIYDELLQNEIDTPKIIINRKEELEMIVRKTRFPNSKLKRIHNFALWWMDSDIAERIIKDIENGRQNEFELRDQIAKEAPGLGYKCSSLLMNLCGYKKVVPIDLWMLRFLERRGYDVKVPDFKEVSGITKKEYLLYEEIFSSIASSYKVCPAEFQIILWCKYSTWRALSKQLELPLVFKE